MPLVDIFIFVIERFFVRRAFAVLLDKICIGYKFGDGSAPIDLPLRAINSVLNLRSSEFVRPGGPGNFQAESGPQRARTPKQVSIETDRIASVPGVASPIAETQANSMLRLARHESNRRMHGASVQI